MGNVGSQIQSSEKVIQGLLGIGLLGILFLVLFGNLSGNLGFNAVANSTENETTTGLTSALLGNNTLSTTTRSGAAGWVITDAWDINGTGFVINLGAANVSVDAFGNVTNLTTLITNYNTLINGAIGTNLTLSYTWVEDSQAEINSEQTIGNLTGGVVTFFSFSNVLFTLVAISLLIGIILVVVNLVRGGRGGSGKGGSGSAAGLGQ